MLGSGYALWIQFLFITWHNALLGQFSITATPFAQLARVKFSRLRWLQPIVGYHLVLTTAYLVADIIIRFYFRF